jgi:hypothetical protein
MYHITKSVDYGTGKCKAHASDKRHIVLICTLHIFVTLISSGECWEDKQQSWWGFEWPNVCDMYISARTSCCCELSVHTWQAQCSLLPQPWGDCVDDQEGQYQPVGESPACATRYQTKLSPKYATTRTVSEHLAQHQGIFILPLVQVRLMITLII